MEIYTNSEKIENSKSQSNLFESPKSSRNNIPHTFSSAFLKLSWSAVLRQNVKMPKDMLRPVAGDDLLCPCSHIRFVAFLYLVYLLYGLQLMPRCEAVKGCSILLDPEMRWKKAICDSTPATLTTIPDDLPNNLVDLQILRQVVRHLNRESLRSLSQLESLVIESSQLESIEPGTFSGMPRLKRLILRNNSIHLGPNGLSGGAIKGLLHLEELDLTLNPLGRLPDDFFEGLAGGRLRRLKLGHVKSFEAFHLEPNSLAPLSRLEEIDLTAARMQTLHESLGRCLSGMPDLKLLLLGKNPWHCDCHLRWLKVWNMIYNRTSVMYHPDSASSDIAAEFEPVCQTPAELRGKSIFPRPGADEIRLSDFYCPPRVFSRDTVVKAGLGSNVTLRCDFFADPAETVVWLKDGLVVKAHWERVVTQVNRANRNFSTVLQITDLQARDTGNWECRINSGIGANSARAVYSLFVHTTGPGGGALAISGPGSGSSGSGLTSSSRQSLIYAGVGASSLIILLASVCLIIFCCCNSRGSGLSAFRTHEECRNSMAGSVAGGTGNQSLLQCSSSGEKNGLDSSDCGIPASSELSETCLEGLEQGLMPLLCNPTQRTRWFARRRVQRTNGSGWGLARTKTALKTPVDPGEKHQQQKQQKKQKRTTFADDLGKVEQRATRTEADEEQASSLLVDSSAANNLVRVGENFSVASSLDGAAANSTMSANLPQSQAGRLRQHPTTVARFFPVPVGSEKESNALVRTTSSLGANQRGLLFSPTSGLTNHTDPVSGCLSQLTSTEGYESSCQASPALGFDQFLLPLSQSTRIEKPEAVYHLASGAHVNTLPPDYPSVCTSDGGVGRSRITAEGPGIAAMNFCTSTTHPLVGLGGSLIHEAARLGGNRLLVSCDRPEPTVLLATGLPASTAFPPVLTVSDEEALEKRCHQLMLTTAQGKEVAACQLSVVNSLPVTKLTTNDGRISRPLVHQLSPQQPHLLTMGKNAHLVGQPSVASFIESSSPQPTDKKLIISATHSSPDKSSCPIHGTASAEHRPIVGLSVPANGLTASACVPAAASTSLAGSTGSASESGSVHRVKKSDRNAACPVHGVLTTVANSIIAPTRPADHQLSTSSVSSSASPSAHSSLVRSRHKEYRRSLSVSALAAGGLRSGASREERATDHVTGGPYNYDTMGYCGGLMSRTLPHSHRTSQIRAYSTAGGPCNASHLRGLPLPTGVPYQPCPLHGDVFTSFRRPLVLSSSSEHGSSRMRPRSAVGMYQPYFQSSSLTTAQRPVIYVARASGPRHARMQEVHSRKQLQLPTP
ncbi:unnamed protein product, partial [Protopolystoma xenopodis]